MAKRVKTTKITKAEFVSAAPAPPVVSPTPAVQPLSIEIKRGSILLAEIGSTGIRITPDFMNDKAANRTTIAPLARLIGALFT